MNSAEKLNFEIQKVAIVGAGTMGAQIAAANIQRNVPVLLADSDPGALATVGDRIAELVAQADRRSCAEVADAVSRLVTIGADDAQIGQCNLVLEAIAEAESIKQQLYTRLEPCLAPTTIWASNTSTIPIGRLAALLAAGERFLGLHFLYPVSNRPLVEVIPGPRTAETTVALATAYVRRLGKLPIVVADQPGFLVNRLLWPYLCEAFELLLDGASVVEVEHAAVAFGMGLGPLRLMDEIGLDTIVAGGRVLWPTFSGRIDPSPLLVAMYKTGRWGRKSGAGFFSYPVGWDATAPGRADPAMSRMIAERARPPQPISSQRIIQRLLMAMLLEATRVLEERQVADPATLDAAMVWGLGFPAEREGLLHWADSLGAAKILEMLAELESLGPRFAATELLRDMARQSKCFHGPPARA